MTDSGYTATEALAALAIIGLAVTGLTSGLHVLGRAQSSTTAALSQATSLRSAGLAMDRLFAVHGAFRSDRPTAFEGDGSHFTFSCGVARCGAQIQGQKLLVTRDDGLVQTIDLPKATQAQFTYGGTDGPLSVWPPPEEPGSIPKPQILAFVAVTDARSATAEPLAISTLWIQQAANCEFDSAIQDCRRANP